MITLVEGKGKIQLKERIKRDTYGGTRIKYPGETIAEVRGKLQQLGIKVIFQKLSKFYKVNFPIYLVQAIDKENKLFSKGMGKGLTEEYAKASGLMELVERYSAANYREENIVKVSFNDVRDKALDPLRLLYSSDTSYHHDKEIDFTFGYSLTHQKEVLIPATFSYFVYNCKMMGGKITNIRDNIKTIVPSNGLASGNCMEEAILHGIFELVERDAVFIMWLNKLNMPGVDVSAVENKYIRGFIEEFKDANVDLHIKYITNDLNKVHTFFCFAVDHFGGTDFPAFSYGCGAHTNPEIALSRGLTELAQIATSITIQKKNMEKEAYKKMYDAGHIKNIKHFCNIRSMQDFDFIINNKDATIIDFKDLKNHSLDNMYEEIQSHVQDFHKKGLEVFAVNLTHPDLNIPAVRVIIPGLQLPVKKDFYEIYTQRLFTVPAQMGYTAKRLEDLNTVELI